MQDYFDVEHILTSVAAPFHSADAKSRSAIDQGPWIAISRLDNNSMALIPLYQPFRRNVVLSLRLDQQLLDALESDWRREVQILVVIP